MPAKKTFPLSTAGCPFYVTNSSAMNGNPIITVTNRPPQFGMFFDGTGNNLENDSRDPFDDKEQTNIAKLYLIYPKAPQAHVNRHYVAGVGTEVGKNDSDLDMAFAKTFGERLNRALLETQRFFRDQSNAPIGILDVFGFSRGAAAARAFVNEVHRINRANPTFWGGPQLIIRFLGIFDTVGSLGIPGDNSNGPHILDLHPDAVRYVYHLTAHHEQREYFPLSSIQTAPGVVPTDCFEEEELPGAHADVGGGYGPVPEVIYYPRQWVNWLTHSEKEEALTRIKVSYEAKYGTPGISIRTPAIDDYRNGPPGSPYRRSLIGPQWVRHVRPQLAHSALQKMHTKATAKGVPFEPLARLLEQPPFVGRAPDDVYAVPSDLAMLLSGARHDTELYLRYIHHSHQFEQTGLVHANKCEKNPDKPASNGIREIFYNQPTRGNSPASHWRLEVVSHGNVERTRWIRK